MPGWEYATIAIDRTVGEARDGAQWVARSHGEVLATGKRITELIDRLSAQSWELVDLGGSGARLQRPADIAVGDQDSSRQPSSNSAA